MPPRTLQADEAIERRFDARRRRCLDERLEPADAAEVGLIVGKQRGASARGADLALACVPTPPCADGGLAIAVRVVGGGGGAGGGKKGSGGGGASSSSSQPSLSSLTLDAEWIAEHARQVARMLPGGLSILGIFVFCPDGAFGSAGALALRAAAAAVADALAPLPPQELLLLHCDSSPSAARKQSLRSLDVPVAPSAPLKPTDLKFAAAAAAAGASLVELRCRHAFDVRVSASPGQALHAALQQAAESEARRVAETPGLAAVGGSSSRLQLPLGGGEGADGEDGGSSSGPSLGDWLAQQAQGAVDDSCVEVSLLLPPPSASSAAISHGGGEARLRGVVVGLAYASRRDGAAGALERLRADVARSLMLRAELAQEEALAAKEEEEQEEAQEEQQEEEGKEKRKRKKKKKRRHPLLARAAGSSGEGADATPVQLALARRVLVPWSPCLPAGPQLHLSEYVLPGEDASEAPTRAAELLFGSNGAAAAAEDVAGAAALEAATAEEVEDGDPPLTGGNKGRSSKATAGAAPPPAARSAAAVAFSADSASPSAAAAGCGGTVAASAAAAAAAAVLAVAVGSYLALG